MIDIDKLETIARAATPGEWECGEDNAAGVNIFGDALWIATVHQNGDESEWDYISSKQMMKNATFIAAANPTAVLELITELRQTRKERDWLADKLESIGWPLLTTWVEVAKEATSAREAVKE